MSLDRSTCKSSFVMNFRWAALLILMLSFIERSETFCPTKLHYKRRFTSRAAPQENLDVLNSEKAEEDNRFNVRSNNRRMNLTWCNKVSCRNSSMIREQIVGEQNQIAFRGSATGQVMFNWEFDDSKNITSYTPRVFLLVKKNDDELLKVAEKVRSHHVTYSCYCTTMI